LMITTRCFKVNNLACLIIKSIYIKFDSCRISDLLLPYILSVYFCFNGSTKRFENFLFLLKKNKIIFIGCFSIFDFFCKDRHLSLFYFSNILL